MKGLIEFSLEGQKQLVRKFRGIQIAGNNWKSTFTKIGKDLTGCFSGPVFETRGAEIGEPWKARTKSYPWEILEKSGAMRKGFKYNADRMSVKIWNITDYFKFHQSRKPRRKLPRRVMLKLDNKRKTLIMKRLHQDLYLKLKGKGLWTI